MNWLLILGRLSGNISVNRHRYRYRCVNLSSYDEFPHICNSCPHRARTGRWPLAARHGHRLGPRDPRSRLHGRPAPRSPGGPTGHRDHGRAPPPSTYLRASTAPCERLVSAHARRPPMTPPGMASRGPPPGPSLLTIARLVSRRPSFSRTRARDRQYILYIAAPAMSFNLTMGMPPF